MCGITGIYNFRNSKVRERVIAKMTDSLTHRGPDKGGVRIFHQVALGHRRLSIIDLSENGDQPMTTEDNRYTIVYNGEVYNFKEIRQKLERIGYCFKSLSDTEVLLKAFQEYNVSCFDMFNGMFAMAIFDIEQKHIYLARDRFGIKPLYYFSNENVFLFGSEIKAIKSYPDVALTMNFQALTEYLWFGNPLGENTFYQEIKEVSAGSFMKISPEGIERFSYFDINNIPQSALSEKETIEKIKVLLEESIQRHLVSDVPVGVFLSGGIDSSAITAYASKHYKGKLKTYSVGFDYDKGVNELPLAKKIAQKYGTEHHEVNISGAEIISTIEKLVEAHDEPFGDAADIPLYLLSKELKGLVKVVLQGDGGDEFFGGYSRYNTVTNVKKWAIFKFLAPLIGLTRTKNRKLLRIQRFLNAITQKEPYKRNALLLTMESKYTNPSRVLSPLILKKIHNTDPFLRYEEVYKKFPTWMDPVQAIFYTDTQNILKDTFFEKVDKSTMANSMEVRVPFIDKELTQFILGVPSSLKTKNGVPKYLLKKALEGIVPDEVLYGKKKGFGVPFAYWLKTSLKGYFIKQVSTEKVKKYIDQKEVIKLFDLHIKGKGYYGFLLWKVLIFSVWLNQNEQLI